MTIGPGTRLGNYEIVAALGEGAMGEVFRARDQSLKRDVAIKVLPEEVSQDPERVLRFEREATLLASLNHPNVATVHGFDKETDGQGRAVSFLVMELVEGRTLAEHLGERGALPWAEARELAAQVASGLEAAHRAGVVHRDLKPANLMIDGEARVKIVDFGLAKDTQAAAVAGGHESATHSPTLAMATNPGVVVGTASYMSPEQARGDAVDSRSDIWSLGCVLWEMLTGSRPFAGDSVVDTVAAVLRQEPEAAQLEGIPESLRRVVLRCLAKRRRARYQHVGDLRLDLEAVSDVAEGSVETATAKRSVLPVAAALVGGLLLGGLAAFLLGRDVSSPVDSQSARAPVPTYSFQVTSKPGAEITPALSPDGKFLAYSAQSAAPDGSPRWNIYLQRVGATRTTNLTEALEGDYFAPDFSPDGSELAFQRGLFDLRPDQPAGIYIVGASGESPRRVAERGSAPDWSPDGRHLVFSRTRTWMPEYRFPSPGLDVLDLTTREVSPFTDLDVADPAWSPDGRFIAGWYLSDESVRDIWVFSADSGEGWPVTDDPSIEGPPEWLSSSELVFPSNRGGAMALFTLRLGAQGRAAGSVVPLAVPATRVPAVSVAPSADRLLFADDTLTGNVVRYPIEPDGWPSQTPELLTEGSNQYVEPRVSPDGRYVAFRRFFPPQAVVVLEVATGRMTTLAEHFSEVRFPTWTPDSRWITYGLAGPEGYGQWVVHVDGTGLQAIEGLEAPANIGTWSPDGKWLATSRGAHLPRLYRRVEPGDASPSSASWATVELVDTSGLACAEGIPFRGGTAWLDAHRRIGVCPPNWVVHDLRTDEVVALDGALEVQPLGDLGIGVSRGGKLRRWRLEGNAIVAEGTRPFPKYDLWTWNGLSLPVSRSHLYASQLEWEGDLWISDLGERNG